MGCLFIFMSLIFLSADIPLGFLAACEQSRLLQCKEGKSSSDEAARAAGLTYLVWLVAEARLEWFCLEDDDYRPQLPDAQGMLHSRGFPGLRLPVAPLLAGDTAKVLAALIGHEPLNRKPPETSVNSED
jgi:hypothetical protein